jgi:hypothetical protein
MEKLYNQKAELACLSFRVDSAIGFVSHHGGYPK